MSTLEQSPETQLLPASNQLDALIALSPWLSEDLKGYEKQISKLSDEQQKRLLELWQIEIKNWNENIGTFSSIVKNLRKEKIETKDTALNTKDSVTNIQEKENKQRYDDAIRAANSANISTKNISKWLNGKYDGEIQEETRQDIGKPETQKYLATLGIDASKPENLATGEVQNILLARASTQVMLRNQEKILKESPDSLKDMDNLSSLRFTLWITDVQYARNSRTLLTDVPSANKESIVDTISTINKSSPDNLVSRTGDRISFADPKNEKYTYEIDLSKQPPQLSKSLGGLSISREIPLLTPEQKEAKEKQDTVKKNLQNSESNYNQWIIDLNQLEREESSIKWIKQEKWSNGEDVQIPIDIYSGVFLTENEQKEAEYTKIKKELLAEDIKPEDRDKKLDAIIKVTEDMKWSNLEKLLNTGETENHSSINKILEWRIEKLKQLQKTNNEVIVAKVEMNKNPPASEDTNDGFEKNAQSTLSYLTHIGYDELWQDVLDKVIASVNAKNQWKIAEIDLSKNPKLDTPQEKELLRVLAQLSRKTDIMHSWKWTDSTDEIIAVRQMSSPNWRISLQDLGKTASFQQIKSASRDTFTDYLYEKPEEKSSINNQS